MKTLLLLGLLLTGFVIDSAPACAAPTAHRDAPDRIVRMRRHLRHQAKVRLRQYRHR